ncbi:hypothetical protein WJX73_007606 [Symbiochloris irregularis]|uniref:Sulfhydryl oxidase n=1 Tax=Symbiochloris irregularis TaxID=706552 RepID=A0AAW1NSY9_9CHLO
MEYYAHWCPGCQAFAPTYEKVAAFFNLNPKPQPEVMVARVDCAEESKLCVAASVRGYPTIKVGDPLSFKSAEAKPQPEVLAGARTADAIVAFVGKFNKGQYQYSEQKVKEAKKKVETKADGSNQTFASEIDLVDVESSTILAFKYIYDSAELLKGEESRQAFVRFVDLVSRAHPVDRCRAGARLLQGRIDTLWLPANALPQPALREQHICGASAQPQPWQSCKGSKEGTRGYTCGLWQALHALAARSPDEQDAGLAWMQTIRGFVKHFFQCSDCAAHYLEMAAEESAQAVRSRREAVLWAWQAHNRVNKRLQQQEASGDTGDPAFPKLQWPPTVLCALCVLPTLSPDQEPAWNLDEVYRFLMRFYKGDVPGALPVKKQEDEHLQLVAVSAAGGRKHLTGAFQPSKRHSWTLDLLLLASLFLAFLALRMWCLKPGQARQHYTLRPSSAGKASGGSGGRYGQQPGGVSGSAWGIAGGPGGKLGSGRLGWGPGARMAAAKQY